MVSIKIYTTTLCGYCLMAKRLLKSRGAQYEEINVSQDSEMRAWLVKETKQYTVPQIFINGVSIGGYTELNTLDRQGDLRRLLLPDQDSS